MTNSKIQEKRESGDELSRLHEALEFVIRQARIIADNPEGSFVKTVAEAIERKCREAVDGTDCVPLGTGE